MLPREFGTLCDDCEGIKEPLGKAAPLTLATCSNTFQAPCLSPLTYPPQAA